MSKKKGKQREFRKSGSETGSEKLHNQTLENSLENSARCSGILKNSVGSVKKELYSEEFDGIQ